MKKQVIIFLFLFISGIIYSQPVDINNAKNVAKNFYTQKYIKTIAANGNSKNDKGNKIKNTIIKEYNGHNSYFANNFEDGGWVIVSSHKALGPVLASSLEGNISENNLQRVCQYRP